MERLFSLPSEIWAKSTGESLEEHTEWCLRIFRQILSHENNTIKRISQKLNIDEREFISRLFATIYLHDIGKASRGVQIYLRNGKRSTPHSLLSLPFTLATLPQINGTSFEAIAILSHHTPFYESLFEDFNGMLINEESYIMPYVVDFFKKLPGKHKEVLGYPFSFELKEPLWNKSVFELRRLAIGDHLLKPPFIREIFALFVSILHTCDWIGSAKDEDIRLYSEYLSAKIETTLKEKTKLESKDWKGWNDFQSRAGQIDGDVFIRIPTGQGKTEAALKWADRKKAKIFYLLPTRVVSNHLYERLQGYFGNYVGLAHGTSILVLAEEKGWNEELYRSEHLKASTGLKPIVVATVDQLLLSMLHFRHWEMLTTNTSDSMIIFDEIHSYDLYTTSLILEATKELKNREAKLCFMSATFPSYLENVLKEIIGEEVPVIYEERFENLCRHNVEWHNQDIASSIDEIINLLNNGMRILIVLNTIPEAVNIYQDLLKRNVPKGKLKLFHSRFIEKDRRRLENDIVSGAFSDGFIAVTTQVIEVGIDIDYDFLYTQVAPLDSLVQRMGRVNRKGRKSIDHPNVFIFSVENKWSDWVYGGDTMKRAKEICQEFHGTLLTEARIRQLIEKQYPIDEIFPSLQRELNETKERLKELRRYLWNIQTVRLDKEDEWLRRIAKTREQRLISLEVIPLQFKEDVKKLTNKVEAIKYHVRIPLWMAKGRLRFFENRIPFVDLGYDEETGIIDPRT